MPGNEKTSANIDPNIRDLYLDPGKGLMREPWKNKTTGNTLSSWIVLANVFLTNP